MLGGGCGKKERGERKEISIKGVNKGGARTVHNLSIDWTSRKIRMLETKLSAFTATWVQATYA